MGWIRTPEYMAWQNMIQRATNPKFKQSEDYSRRGITVCAEWRGRGGFKKFLAEIGPRPGAGFSVDRKENDLGYQPGNVRWATSVVQNNNARKNVTLTIDGVTKTLAEWSAETGIGHSTLRYRKACGLSDEDVVRKPLRTLKGAQV